MFLEGHGLNVVRNPSNIQVFGPTPGGDYGWLAQVRRGIYARPVMNVVANSFGHGHKERNFDLYHSDSLPDLEKFLRTNDV
jgi:hypothetical protein